MDWSNQVAIGLDAHELLGVRYPRQIPADDGFVRVQPLQREASVAGYVREAWSADDDLGAAPVLLSVEALAELRRQQPVPVLAEGSLVYLPFGRSGEVTRWRDQDFEPPRHIHLRVPVGFPTTAMVELEAPFARTVLEALVLGQHLAERLTDASAGDLRWTVAPRNGHPAGTAALAAGEGHIDLDLVPVGLTAVSSWSAEIQTATSRVLLRDEFAPSSYGRKTADGPWRFERIPVPKPNVQAPDTVAGGWETAGLLSSLVRGDAAPDEGLDAASRYLAQAERLLD